MSIHFIDPTDVTPNTTGSWTDVDVSSHVTSDATGVALHVENQDSSNDRFASFRKKGSTDSKQITYAADSHNWRTTGVDANQVFQAYIGTNVKVWLVGYFADESVFFDNLKDKTPSTTDQWVDIDISGDTGTDTAIAVILENQQSLIDWGVRKKGSTDTQRNFSNMEFGAIVGVDSNEVFQAYIDSTSSDQVKVRGYIKDTANASFNTNATAVTVSSNNTWETHTLPSGARGAFVQVIGSNDNEHYGVRKGGSSETITRDHETHAWAYVGADFNDQIELYAENSADVTFYIVGYSETITKTVSDSLTAVDPLMFMRPGEPSLKIDGVVMNDNWENISIVKRLNEMWAATVNLAQIVPEQHTHVQEGKTVEVFVGTTKIYKGEIDNVNYSETGLTDVNVVNMRLLRDFDFRALSNGIYRESSSTAADTIVSKILSENVDGSSPFIIPPGTNDVTTSTTFRAEGDTNRFQALQHLATIVDGEFWQDEDSNGNNEINFTSTKGASSSQKTFHTSGSNQNADVAQRFIDDSQLWNKITVRGYAEDNSRVEATASDSTSINDHGERQKVHTDTRIRSNAEAQELADKILAEHKTPVERYTLVVDDITEVLPDLVIGDTITIKDPKIYETDVSDKTFRIIAMRINFSQDRGFSVTLECASKTLNFSADFLAAQKKIAGEQQRAQNETQEDTTQDTTKQSTTESVTGVQISLDSNQKSSLQGHASNQQTTTALSSSMTGTSTMSRHGSFGTQNAIVKCGVPNLPVTVNRYWIQINFLTDGTSGSGTISWEVNEDDGTSIFSGSQSVSSDVYVSDDQGQTLTTIGTNFIRLDITGLPPGATVTDATISVVAIHDHSHDVPSTNVNGLVSDTKLTYDLDSGGTPKGSDDSISTTQGNRSSSDNLDTRTKPNFN